MLELDKGDSRVVIDSRLVGLHMKVMLQFEPFAIPKNWLAIGRAVEVKTLYDYIIISSYE